MWGRKQKSDRKVIFLCAIDYLDSAEIYNWVGNNTLVSYTHSSLLDVYVTNYVCNKTIYMVHSFHHVKQLKHFTSTHTHAYRTFVYALIPITRAICLTDISLTVTICPICSVTSWHESLSTTLNMQMLYTVCHWRKVVLCSSGLQIVPHWKLVLWSDASNSNA